MAGAELRAAYRLQLTSDFGFAAAAGLVPYLRDLGISHLYLSPSLQARAGSTHGYDVVDPQRLSDALGGEEQFAALADEVRGAGMGIVLDVVPNHMAVDDANRYWVDPALRERFFDLDPVTGRHRRFFDIDDMAGVRQEDPVVFDQTHALVLSLVADGSVDGLRIDHPDGLADPAGYLRRLRDAGAERVWVEKILDRGERLPDWPVCGTVGYEFLNDVCALFVDPHGDAALTSLWEEISGVSRSFDEVAMQAKLEQVQGTFAPEVDRLERLDPPLAREDLERGLAAMRVYRTYIEPASGSVSAADRAAIAYLDPPLRSILLLETPVVPEFITRFQQTTPAVIAKGVEDTAFYRYARLLALNDVGGDPSRFGIDVTRFHAGNLERGERLPLNLLTTQTHDAKRSGDVRARIAALASIPEEWTANASRWLEITEPLRDGEAPDDVERYFIFQTLVGSWPISAERLEAYIEKALREAKRNTNWVEHNTDWEAAVKRYCHELCSYRPFLDEFEPLAARVAAVGDRFALGQVALKLTAPGIPDIYQGDELPLRALVDPDNRRPVDWEWHRAMLDRLLGGSPPDSRTYKLFLTMRLLGLRARRPEPFLGSYEPLEAGERACAFLRGEDILVVVAIRAGASDGVLEVPAGRWRDVLVGDEHSLAPRQPLAELLDDRGLAVFERMRSS
ncbi:MAG: malto-oligosyltrehalose synthase [Solirubrobacteraceae bacterium]